MNKIFSSNRNVKCLANFLKCLSGIGILAIPKAFKYSGYIMGVIGLVLCFMYNFNKLLHEYFITHTLCAVQKTADFLHEFASNW